MCRIHLDVATNMFNLGRMLSSFSANNQELELAWCGHTGFGPQFQLSAEVGRSL